MITFNNLFNNNNMREIDSLGCVKVFEHQRDISINPDMAVKQYYSSAMEIKKRQVFIDLHGGAFAVSAGAMQWFSGNITMTTGIKGFGDLMRKSFAGGATKESAVKPIYEGNGFLMLEPTYKHILLEDVSEWQGLVLEDGLFLACESHIEHKVVMRNRISSAALGGEGLFNLMLRGKGVAVLESPVPRDELIMVDMIKDVIKIDGHFAVAWSNTLEFTVERSAKTLVGSAMSGEGLVNVYRGTGRILLAPVL